MKSIIEYSHAILKEHLTSNDIAIDMTVGNGHDTLFLVQNVKYVYGFDIQEIACFNTKKKLANYQNYQIINDSHENFLKYVNDSYKGVIFNLGYLPKGNKEICTQAKTTLKTLDLALKHLEIQGICVVVIYPGHPEGYQEAIELEEYLRKLDQKEYDVLKYQYINQINNPPYLVAIWRKR